MILSVSRRTDIPNYYSEWFFNRIKEGYLYVRNPMNAHQISKIHISPEVVDCIVFWTKNPENMMGNLDILKDYYYCFQFTLTGYGKDIEPGLPEKPNHLISTFQTLSRKIGAEKMIWRYDPILLNPKYTAEYHIKAFEDIAGQLRGYTNKVVISFVDIYTKIRQQVNILQMKPITDADMIKISKAMAEIAVSNDMIIETCAEHIDLTSVGVAHGSCINKTFIENIIGSKLQGSKDKNQRPECGCFESVEVGTYNTCKNGCKYCYANFSPQQVKNLTALYDPNSPLLCGTVGYEDKITERKVKSLRVEQLSFLDQL